MSGLLEQVKKRRSIRKCGQDMKKKAMIILLTCALLSGIVMIVHTVTGGKKPYKDLEPSEISSASVRLEPPDQTVQIAEIQELVSYLNDVVIYKEDNSYTEYSGQGAFFTLTMTDGTQTEIVAYYPFLVIDGVGYTTGYEPCEALNAYANKLLNDKNASIISEDPK